MKSGNAAADDMDEGKENGLRWIKKKLNTASTRGGVMLVGVTNTKGWAALAGSRSWLRFCHQTLHPLPLSRLLSSEVSTQILSPGKTHSIDLPIALYKPSLPRSPAPFGTPRNKQ